MGLDRNRFFRMIRLRPWKGRLSTGQVAGLNAILDGWEGRAPDLPATALAYVLATAASQYSHGPPARATDEVGHPFCGRDGHDVFPILCLGSPQAAAL